MIKKLSIAALALLFCAGARANGDERPKIGLVLGGGGALGFAHVGVIRVLEELQVPIDYIGGTSMGAIVAGMYASGMSPDEMERSFTELDWWDVLKDQSPHQYLVYRRKEDDRRLMGAEVGFNHAQLQFRPGMAHGQKLDNILETFALNSTGITDFDQLNIPYRAVATDLRRRESVVLDSGSLARAMRASMAVPGAFTPVRMDDRVFVDGGIFNNIPVDVVRAMGADIIIAVDVGASGAEKSDQSDFRSLPEVVGRTYIIMQRPNQEKQLARADLVIQPDLTDYSSTHFHKSAEIIPCGTAAAEQLKDELRAYTVDDSEYAAFLEKQRLKHESQIVINDIRIMDNSGVAEESIRFRVHSTEGPLDLDMVNRDLRRIYGMGGFQTVTYDVQPNGDAYALIYHTQEKYWGPGFLHFGMKFESATDTSMLWSLLLNYTRTQLNDFGGEVRLDLEGGGHKRKLHTEWYQPFVRSGRFFIAPSATLMDEDIDIYSDDQVIAEVDLKQILGRLDFGISGFQYGEIRIGLFGGHVWEKGQSGFIPLGELDDHVAGISARFELDQLDDPFFPNKGYQVTLQGDFAKKELGSGHSYNRLEASARLPLSLGRHTLIPRVRGGSSFGTQLPFYSTFHLGGMDSFAGYGPYQQFGNYYGVISLGYRFRLGRLPPTLGNGVFALARLDAGNAWDAPDDADIKDLNFGGLVGVGADTAIGRFVLSMGKAEELNHVRLYLSVGNDF
ncbi:patatin-like phospholipase family protein [Pontiella sp.]|uniref:patatin-like phospholipase family protein n=1 Tax=Pontiella sp. TaxID=2837462 RepID=UPI003567900B